MTGFLILGAMALAAAALIVLPLTFKRRQAAGRAAFDRAVFRDQLEELERDIARGVITEGDAEAARTEIERRILATAAPADRQDGPGEGGGARTSGASRGVILALAALLPLAAGAIYLNLGSPGLPDEPFADRSPGGGTGAPSTAQIARMVEMLERRLKEHPDEIQGWIILSTAYLHVGRLADAEKAHNRALELSGADKARGAAISVEYGEALVTLADGRVTPPAKAAFERARALNPDHPAANYYLGLARLQDGDAEGALAVWRRIAAGARKDAPWLPKLKARIERLAKERGADPDPGATDPGR